LKAGDDSTASSAITRPPAAKRPNGRIQRTGLAARLVHA
jgi:hypothetical protein